jgi:hypothetical protein
MSFKRGLDSNPESCQATNLHFPIKKQFPHITHANTIFTWPHQMSQIQQFESVFYFGGATFFSGKNVNFRFKRTKTKKPAKAA